MTTQRLFHVAPRSARESIQQHGLDATRGASPWASAPVGFQEFPQGNYLWTDLAAAQAYRVYDDPTGQPDVWEVSLPEGARLVPDPMGTPNAVLVTAPIPAGSLRLATAKTAMPSWRDRGERPVADCIIVPDVGRSRGNFYEVFTYGQPVARFPRLAQAKEYVEQVYGPVPWRRVPGDKVPREDPVWGFTTEFNDAPYFLVVDRLPTLGKTAMPWGDKPSIPSTKYGEGYVARGMTFSATPSMARQIIDGTVTATNILRAIEPLGVWWWPMGNGTTIEDPMTYAEGMGDPNYSVKGLAEDGDLDDGEVCVVIVAKSPKRNGEWWDPEKHNEANSLMGNSYLREGERLEIVEVMYDAGWGWKSLPAQGVRVTATHKTAFTERPATPAENRAAQTSGSTVIQIPGAAIQYSRGCEIDPSGVTVHSLFVDADKRRQGLATRLLDHLAERFAGRGMDPGGLTDDGAPLWHGWVAANGWVEVNGMVWLETEDDFEVEGSLRREATFFMHDADEPLIDTKPMEGFEEKASFEFVHPQIATGGALRYKSDMRILARRGVKGVVNGRRDFDDALLMRGQEGLGIKTLYLPTPDNGASKPTSWFKAAIDFCLPILKSGGKVYIHCHAGMNRGPSLAYAVLRAYTGWEHDSALAHIKRCRSVALVAYADDADRALVELGYVRERAEVDTGSFHTLTGAKTAASLKADWWHACSQRRADEVRREGGFRADYSARTAVYGPGIYLTSERLPSTLYGKDVLPLKVEATRPFEVNGSDWPSIRRALAAAGIDHDPTGDRETDGINLVDSLKAKGYDCLLLERGQEDWLLVFDPSQVRYDPAREMGKAAAKTAGPGSGRIPKGIKARPPFGSDVFKPRPVKIGRVAAEDIRDLDPDEQRMVIAALKRLERGTERSVEAKRRPPLVGCFSLDVTTSLRVVFYLHVQGHWDVMYVGHHDYAEAERRMRAAASKTDPCTACGGSGEQPSGHECYICDSTGLGSEERDSRAKGITNDNPENGLPVGTDLAKTAAAGRYVWEYEVEWSTRTPEAEKPMAVGTHTFLVEVQADTPTEAQLQAHSRVASGLATRPYRLDDGMVTRMTLVSVRPYGTPAIAARTASAPHLGSLGGRRLFWRFHPAHRPFLMEEASSAPLNNWLNERARRGYSAVKDPWNLVVYAASMGWLNPSGMYPSNHDDVIAFTGEVVGEGHDGEPLVLPDMKVVYRYDWGQFERELLDTPFPSKWGWGTDGGQGDWRWLARDLADAKGIMWRDGVDPSAPLANHIIKTFAPERLSVAASRTAARRVQEVYTLQMAVRPSARKFTLDQATTMIRRILKAERFPQAEHAEAVPHPSGRTSSVAWDFGTTPPTPLVAFAPQMQDEVTLIHECAHIVRNGHHGFTMTGPQDPDGAHDDQWFQTYNRLIGEHAAPPVVRAFRETFGLPLGAAASKTAAPNRTRVFHGDGKTQYEAKKPRLIVGYLSSFSDNPNRDNECAVEVPWEGDLRRALQDAERKAERIYGNDGYAMKQIEKQRQIYLLAEGASSYVLAVSSTLGGAWKPVSRGVKVGYYNHWPEFLSLLNSNPKKAWDEFCMKVADAQPPSFNLHPMTMGKDIVTIYRGISLGEGHDPMTVDRSSTGIGGKGVGNSWTLDLSTAKAIAERGQAGFVGDNTRFGQPRTIKAIPRDPNTSRSRAVVLRAEVDLSQPGMSLLSDGRMYYASEQEVELQTGIEFTMTGWMEADQRPVDQAAMRRAIEKAKADVASDGYSFEDYQVTYRWPTSWKTVKVRRTAAVGVGVPLRNVRIQKKDWGGPGVHVYLAEVASGAPLVYRNIGNRAEMEDAVLFSAWSAAKGGFTSRDHEGETQFTTNRREALAWSHDLRNETRGYWLLVTADITGQTVKFVGSENHRTQQNIGHPSRVATNHFVNYGDGTGVYYPDHGLGIGVEGEMNPARVIKRVETFRHESDGRIPTNKDWTWREYVEWIQKRSPDTTVPWTPQRRAAAVTERLRVVDLVPEYGGSARQESDPVVMWSEIVRRFRRQHAEMPDTTEWAGMKQREDVLGLAADMKANGQQEPVIVERRSDGTLVLKDGTHRAAAAFWNDGPGATVQATVREARVAVSA